MSDGGGFRAAEKANGEWIVTQDGYNSDLPTVTFTKEHQAEEAARLLNRAHRLGYLRAQRDIRRALGVQP